MFTKEHVLFSSEVKMTRLQAASFLRQLAEKIDVGQVTLHRGAEHLSFDLPDDVTLELKVEEKPKRHGSKKTFELELEWLEGDFVTNEPVKLG